MVSVAADNSNTPTDPTAAVGLAEPAWLGPVIDIGRSLHRYWNRRDSSWTEASLVREGPRGK
jgi:hypothetical protein